jgi:type VI protein secretion system component VasF
MDSAVQWNGRDRWKQRPLEFDYFGSETANESFYERADEAMNPGIDDGLEAFYVCFMLGFRGLYRDEERTRPDFALVTTKYKVPVEPADWAERVFNVVKQRRDARPSDDEDHTHDRPRIDRARPLWRLDYVLWPWLVALLLGGCTFMFYWHFIRP